MEGDELGAVLERRFDLDLGEQVGDALHDVGVGEDVATVLHQVCHPPPVAGRLEHPGGEHGDRLGMVESQPPAVPRAGDTGGLMEHQSLLLVRAETHAGRTVRPLGEHNVSPESRSVARGQAPRQQLSGGGTTGRGRGASIRRHPD